MGFFTERVGTMIGNFIGQFLEYDNTNKGAAWKPYMRIKVMIDVSMPLKRKKKIKIGTGEYVVVNFKYEKLRLFCFICGKLDHTESRCDKLFDSVDGVVEKRWGPELKAPDRFGKPLVGDKWLKQEDPTTDNSTDYRDGHSGETLGGPRAGQNEWRSGSSMVKNRLPQLEKMRTQTN